jgi:hypothetical protein
MVVQNVVAVLMLVLTCIAIWYSQMRVSQGKVPTIRRLPAMDALEEAIALCAEKGKPAWFPLGAAPIDDPQGTPGHIITMSIMGYTTKYAADMGVKILSGTIRTPLIPMMDDVLAEGYRVHGAPELHALEDIRYYPSQMAYIAGNDTVHKYDQPGCQIMLGVWWAETPAFCEIAKRAGAFMIGGTDYIENVPYLVAFCDYSLVFEEIYAAGAYVSDDPAQKANIFAEDIMKFLLLALTVVGAIALAAGFTDFATWLSM